MKKLTIFGLLAAVTIACALLLRSHAKTSREKAEAFRKNFEPLVVAAKQEPTGSKTSWSLTTNDNQIVIHFHNYTSGSNWTVGGGSVPISLPYIYKDAESGIMFYVEKDGRHVSAISPAGQILWSRDPFTDSHLPFYRTTTPRIVSIGRWKGILAISFDSSQYGNLDIKTGDFTFGGQD